MNNSCVKLAKKTENNPTNVSHLVCCLVGLLISKAHLLLALLIVVTESRLGRVNEVKETILVDVLAVESGHGRTNNRELTASEKVHRFVAGKLHALTDNVKELTDGKLLRDKILFLVNIRDVALGGTVDNDGDAVREFFKDLKSVSTALL